MSNSFLYTCYGLSREKSKVAHLRWALPDFPRLLGKGKGDEGAKILGLVLLLLFFPGWLSAQEPLRAGTIFSATQTPLWAAKEGRFFEKYGVKILEVIQFSGGQPVTRALIGGDIQISTTGGAAVVTPRLKGADTATLAHTPRV